MQLFDFELLVMDVILEKVANLLANDRYLFHGQPS